MVASESMINQPKLSVCREALDESRDGLGSQLRRFILGAAMKEIPLTQGKFAIVDDEDYEWVMQWKWCATKNGKIWYVKRKNRNPPPTSIYLHREILQRKLGRLLPGREYTDHIDRNGLNNQRINLRAATPAQNNKHKRKDTLSKSKYWGCVWINEDKKWSVRLRNTDGTCLYLGRFTNEVEAARCFDQASMRLYGEFANVNFPEIGINPNWAFPIRVYSSPYRGVAWHGAQRKWQVRAARDRRIVTLGYYRDEIEAARAYDKFTFEYTGKKSRLNFPSEYE